MSFTALPENPHRALEALAIHRYLTAKQLVDLGIAASPTVARDHILNRHLKMGRYPLVKPKILADVWVSGEFRIFTI